MSFDIADGPSRFNPSDKSTNNNPEQPSTENDLKCQRKVSDDSDLGPPNEGFSPLFVPSDETMEHRLSVAVAATGE